MSRDSWKPSDYTLENAVKDTLYGKDVACGDTDVTKGYYRTDGSYHIDHYIDSVSDPTGHIHLCKDYDSNGDSNGYYDCHDKK